MVQGTTWEPRGKLSQWVAANQNDNEPSPQQEAQRLMPLATAAGIKTTVGSLAQGVRMERKRKGTYRPATATGGRRPGVRPVAPAPSSMRAWLAGREKPNERITDAARRLLPEVQAAGFPKTTVASIVTALRWNRQRKVTAMVPSNNGAGAGKRAEVLLGMITEAVKGLELLRGEVTRLATQADAAERLQASLRSLVK